MIGFDADGRLAAGRWCLVTVRDQAGSSEGPTFRIHEQQRAYALRTLHAYVEKVEGLVLPAFGDVSKTATPFDGEELREEDGAAVRAEKLEALAQWSEAEEERKDLDFVRDRILEMSVAGLYHLWERRIKHMLRSIEEAQAAGADASKSLAKINRADFEDTILRIARCGWKVEEESFFAKLTELRLVANAVKHGEGKSLDDLWAASPRLFWPYAEEAMPVHFGTQERGDNSLEIRSEHFRDFAGAVEAFWRAVPSADRP